MAPRGRATYTIQSVENALDVLEALSEGGEEVRISSLSQRLGMNKTSVFRLLATFETRGYVERTDGSSKYCLGPSAYEIAQKLLSRMGLLRKAKPVMEKLVRSTNEAVYLTVRRGQEVLFFDMVDTTHQVKIVTLVGRRFPLIDSAAGRVLLAFGHSADDPVIDQQLAGELVRTQTLGYCTDAGALGEGVTALAVPILSNNGKLAGSLCLVGPGYRMNEQQIEKELLPQLSEAGIVISSKLGYVGHYLGQSGN